MYRYIRSALLALLLIALFVPMTASAHGRTTVGDYELVIGFRVEPAYQSEPNGLDLRITNTKSGEPVKDLADKLHVEIIFGSSKQELEVRPQFGKDGSYTAHVLPTAAGDYTWHIWGDINGTPLDVSMASSSTTFSAVQTKDSVAFPAPEPTAAELRDQAGSAAQAAQLALIVGIVGIVLGVAGLVVGILGMRARRSASAETGRVHPAA